MSQAQYDIILQNYIFFQLYVVRFFWIGLAFYLAMRWLRKQDN